MKKVIILMLTLILSFSLTGCGGEQIPEDTPAKNNTVSTLDITNMDTLYEYVNAEIYEITREDFDTMIDVTLLDVTNDGNEDALLVICDWETNIEIVTVEDNQYKHIPTDVSETQYRNDFEMKDGFLTVVQAVGGTGIRTDFMSLLKYDNGRMITVLDGLEISHYESSRDWNVERSSEIKGPLTDFEYILTVDDNGDKLVEYTRYTYNEATMSFDIEYLNSSSVDENQESGNQAADNQKYNLADLNDGDAIGGGFFINQIEYRKNSGTASFTLEGEIVLTGKLYYDEMYQCLMVYDIDEKVFPAFITIEGNSIAYDYKPKYIGFRNEDMLLGAISETDLREVKNGRSMNVKLKVKDFHVGLQLESEGYTGCELVEFIEGSLS